MEAKEKKQEMHLEVENLAMPEVHFSKEPVEEIDEEGNNIDYSGAVPEVHIKKK